MSVHPIVCAPNTPSPRWAFVRVNKLRMEVSLEAVIQRSAPDPTILQISHVLFCTRASAFYILGITPPPVVVGDLFRRVLVGIQDPLLW